MRKLAMALGLLLAALVVLFLVLRVPDIPHETLVERYADDASRFVELPSGARVHYRDQGRSEGPVLVLVHGSNASLHTWEPWVDQLGDELRIVSLDLQGHGLTGSIPSDDYSIEAMVETVEQLRAELGIASWSVAGNSMGGAVAWSYALEYPDRVEALVLVDAAGFWPRQEDASESGALAFRLAAMPGVNRVLSAVMPRSLFDTTLKRAIYDDAQVTDAMVDRYWELNRHPGTRRATRLRMMGYRDRLGEEPPAERITVPTLVMSGKEDLLIPPNVAEQFHERIPRSRLVIYPEVGHVPMEEIPVRSAGDVRAFLEEVGLLSRPAGPTDDPSVAQRVTSEGVASEGAGAGP